MSVQYLEKSSNFTTTSSSIKTPFGIEDILYINNNNQSVNNKNVISAGKPATLKNNDPEETKKMLSNER